MLHRKGEHKRRNHAAVVASQGTTHSIGTGSMLQGADLFRRAREHDHGPAVDACM